MTTKIADGVTNPVGNQQSRALAPRFGLPSVRNLVSRAAATHRTMCAAVRP